MFYTRDYVDYWRGVNQSIDRKIVRGDRKVSSITIQVVATNRYPQLLRLLSSQSLEYASLTYRLSNRSDAQIKRILDIREAQRVINEQDLARLHESGWLEDKGGRVKRVGTRETL